MARRRGIVLALVAIAAAGCGLAGVPGMGPGFGGSRPSVEEPDTPPVPRFTAPVISDEAMERAVQAGLARSDDETWRKIQGCLTPGRSQVEQMMEQLQSQRRPGAQPDPGQLAFRSASLDPRLGRARVLTQQGLLDASYVLLVDVLCEYTDGSSKSSVLSEMVSNREEAGDLETAVWFVEGWLRADEASLLSQQSIVRQQQAQIQSAQGRLGALMGSGGFSAEMARTMERQARDMRARMLLPAATSYARLGDVDRARGKLAEAQAMMGPNPAGGGREEDSGHLYYMLAEAAARVGDLPAAQRAHAEGERRRDRARPDPSAASLSLVYAQLGHYDEARRLAEATVAEAAGWSMEPRPARGSDPSDRMGADLERAGNRMAAAATVETADTALVEVAVARGEGEVALRYLAAYDAAHARRLETQRELTTAMQSFSSMGGFAPVFESVSAQLRATAYKERAQRAWRYGQAYALAGRPREAAASLLDAVAIIESLRGLIRSEDRVAFFGRHTSPYAALVDSLLVLPRTDDIATLPVEFRGQSPAEVAFHYAEAARARLLSEQIARAFVGAAERDLPADVRERERTLQNAAAAELRRGVPYDGSAAYADFQSFVETLRQSHADYATLKYPVPVTARQVPLRDNEALIAYAVLERRVAVWLLRKGEPLRVFLSPVRREDLLATVEAFRRSVDVSGGNLPTFDAVAAEKLYRWLLAEPLALVAANTTVIVVPDGVLSTVPFEALGPRAAAGGPPAFAGGRYTFAYVPSATVLTFERTAKRNRGATGSRPLLAVGDPVYEDLERQAAPASPERRALATRSAREAIKKRGPVVFAPLPATRTEVNRIAATLGVPPDSPDIRLGRSANEKDLKALDLGAYRFLHFATHGVLAGDVPYLNQPALVLSQTADLGGEDGFLTMSEVLRLSLKSDMVVLSACQTALGREVTGEGVVGLSRAFLYAGSRAAVVSLWPVDDVSTAVFMTTFYAHVKGGLPPARALARAKQELRANPAHAHPFYWAPFVFFGAD